MTLAIVLSLLSRCVVSSCCSSYWSCSCGLIVIVALNANITVILVMHCHSWSHSMEARFNSGLGLSGLRARV